MSARSIRRSRERELARAGRRRCRASLAAGAAIGAGAALAAPAAQAANFPVTNTNNAGANSLRAAVAGANGSAGLDNITFSGAGASGQITLTGGEIGITDDLTITGPGASALSVSGDRITNGVHDFAINPGNQGDTRIFDISDATSPGSPVQQVSISGLTLKDAVASRYTGTGFYGENGGAIRSDQTALSLTNMTFTNNVSTSDGGAVYVTENGPGNVGSLAMSSSTLTGNTALDDGGGLYARTNKYSSGQPGLVVTGSQFTANRAGGTNFGGFGNSSSPEGGALRTKYGTGTIDSVTIAGNEASTTSAGNTRGRGGGASLSGGTVLSNSNVTGNTGGETGGGLVLRGAKVRSSTISGNTAPGLGGGILATPKYGGGPARIDDSTVTGNTATGPAPDAGLGGGVGTYSYSTGAVTLITRNSTIAANIATTSGGGILGVVYQTPQDPGVELKSTIVADNTASGSASDLAAYAPPVGVSTAGLFSAGFSLVESPGGVTLVGDPAGSNITGVDPGLSPLAINGGPTETQALSPTSAAIDAAQANGFTTDQRGQPRTVDAAATDNSISDGTDIGAFEVQDVTAPGDDPDTEFSKKPPKKVKLKDGKSTAKVKLKFTGTDNAGAPGPLTFECKIDKGPFEACKSPLKLKLKKGKHTVAVQATDADGNVDSSPATAKIKVKRKKPKK